ncbi:MAG TPA: toll/interleukin-1 receptor domain-containing protein [Vicinamibacterales bacterium]
MSHIFICYRRDDSAGHAGRLRDALSAEFGADSIFRDLDTIGPGDDFVQAITRGVASCTVFLAIVGRNWLTASDRDGRRRLDVPSDHVRSELSEALQCGVRVIPVLVQSAPMPQPSDLPDPLKPFADRNAIALDDDDWQSDVQRLVQAIRRELGEATAPHVAVATRRLPFWVMAAGAVVIALVLIGVLNRNRSAAPSRSDTLPPGISSANLNPPSAPSSSPSSSAHVTLPSGGEIGLGQVVYEILDATVSAGAETRTLNLRIRLTNHGRYPAGFGSDDFRLRTGDELREPTARLGDAVGADATKDNTISFLFPASLASATLRVGSGDAIAEIPLDLNGRTGSTATQDRELRVSGKRTAAAPLDAEKARLHFGDLTYDVRSASVHRYANKIALTLNVRAQNNGQYPGGFGDSLFRLVLDGTARAPVSGLSAVVPSQSSLDGAIVFDLPLEARDVVVRVRSGETTNDLPLKIPAIR